MARARILRDPAKVRSREKESWVNKVDKDNLKTAFIKLMSVYPSSLLLT